MNPLTVSIALSTTLLCAAPALLQGGKERPPRQAPDAASAPLVKDLQGAWKLVEFESKVLPRTRRSEVGYLLVAGEFLSFECHFGWTDDAGQSNARTFFSGTHAFELRADGVMVMTSLIGTTVHPQDIIPLFEQPGRKREYKVSFEGTKLTLLREADEQTFRFVRHVPDQELDFYGRRKKPAPPAEPPPPRDGEKKE
jgi:hypothetical protein